ncbi:sugar-binding transcriptional regulator [Pseudoflavonifractor intestinihominis]|uniref:Sugar-binding domain-containing protein n=1 Tax=Pseudoflavonifractor intestinihominis TaxID=3133171 RepID=A0ABV1E6X8_9FIRM|nr:sugar-binding domain-containing protein [uncultured Pseudoflavonifractor sp.]
MEEDLLLKIAHMYYGLGMTQEKIAKQLFFSRSRISHLLTEAEEKGYVRFEVRPMVYQPINLKNYFFQHFNLHDAIIVEGRYCVGNEIFSEICRSAADYLATQLTNDTVLNVSRGRTMYSIVQNLSPHRPLPGMKVVQTEGLLGMEDPYLEQTDFVRRIGDAFHCEYYCMMLPYIFDSPQLRDAVLNLPINYPAVEMAEQITVICSSLLTLEQWKRWLSEDEYKMLGDLGIVGSIQGNFYNQMGEFIDTPLNSRFIAPPRKILEQAKQLICVSTGLYKAQALLGLLRTGLVHTLITDSMLAERVKKLEQR